MLMTYNGSIVRSNVIPAGSIAQHDFSCVQLKSCHGCMYKSIHIDLAGENWLGALIRGTVSSVLQGIADMTCMEKDGRQHLTIHQGPALAL